MKEYIKKTNNPKMGRPKIEIKQDEFEKLCAMQCTEEEIAGWYRCSVDTLENWCRRTYKTTFSAIYKTLSANGKMSLRRTQFRIAETNASMAIFLGKQYLGQRDVIEQDVNDNGLLGELTKAIKQHRDD